MVRLQVIPGQGEAEMLDLILTQARERSLHEPRQQHAVEGQPLGSVIAQELRPFRGEVEAIDVAATLGWDLDLPAITRALAAAIGEALAAANALPSQVCAIATTGMRFARRPAAGVHPARHGDVLRRG